ncbi:short chain dehydrogenase [Falsiruegeria litorea R37]|uniref:Short chain dehydrogenase n=1 Tax=Falsiruegeria litorea R37 TaxID=1200284 RepID=A0A1Y5TCG0_9RHOB|nr:alpha/beta fold hydrolase [Falsiruegeria litorea]SLN60581.1 short chain dehydrogenase [Falsiruegeria litorea R37]
MQADPQILPIRYTARCADGVRIACYRFANPGGVPVIVVHGTFSSHEGCTGLARRLADDGLDVWAMDWRGRGGSELPDAPFDFDTIAQMDIPAVLDLVQAETGQRTAIFVTHSGGGLIIGMWAARNPDLANGCIRGLVTMAAQAHLAAERPEHRQRIAEMARYLETIDIIPPRQMGVGSERESAHLMQQWCRWNLEGQFLGSDGFDYLPALGALDIPLLCLIAGGDHFVAPRPGCENFAKAFGSADRTIQICGKDQGFIEDYEHGRILASTPARIEIWPLVANWVGQRAKTA